MKLASDNKTLTNEDVEKIIQQFFHETKSSVQDQKGAGSFCRFIEFEGNKYALLTPRAEKLVFSVLERVMQKIQAYKLPVQIVGAAADIEKKGDYAIIMPRIEGLQLPSQFFAIGKNLQIMSEIHLVTQKASDGLINECIAINGDSVHIDFHGANFTLVAEGDVRMYDLRQEGKFPQDALIKRILRMNAYTQMSQFQSEDKRKEILDEQAIDVDFITAESIVKAYISLIRMGYNNDVINIAIKQIFSASNNKIQSIDYFAKQVPDFKV